MGSVGTDSLPLKPDRYSAKTERLIGNCLCPQSGHRVFLFIVHPEKGLVNLLASSSFGYVVHAKNVLATLVQTQVANAKYEIITGYWSPGRTVFSG